MRVLNIDREFQKITIPLPEEEMNALANDIAENGCREPLRIWRGLLVDGYKRYEICRKYRFSFECIEMEAESREKIVEQICRERCTADRKHDAAFKYAVGRWYINGAVVCKIEKRETWITYEIAEAIHMCTETVNSFVRYSKWLDSIDEKDHRFADKILHGHINIRNDEIKRLSQYQIGTFHRKKKELLQKEGLFVQTRERPRKTPEEKTFEPEIKKRPQFDPDAEIKSLAFTLPTWVEVLRSKMERTDMNATSDQAKEALEKVLIAMKRQIEKALEAVKC